jgi:hypothetical protein
VQIANHLVEPEGKVPADVLEDAELRAQYADGVRNVGPQVPLVLRTGALARVAERLTGVAGGHDGDGLNGPPVHLGEIAVVGNLGVVVRENLGGRLVVLDMPGGLPA